MTPSETLGVQERVTEGETGAAAGGADAPALVAELPVAADVAPEADPEAGVIVPAKPPEAALPDALLSVALNGITSDAFAKTPTGVIDGRRGDAAGRVRAAFGRTGRNRELPGPAG